MDSLTFNTPMLVSTTIMIVTFIGIFTEGLHGFHRTKFALLGATAMMIAGQILNFYSPEAALGSVDWNVVLLLGTMMTIVAIMIPTGGFQIVAYSIAHYSGGRLFLLMLLMGAAVTLFSLMLDNVTTVVIFGPLIVLIAQSLKISPIPYLLAAAMLSNIGGVATLVGDPPNLMIGSTAHIDFNTFFMHMGGIVLAVWIAVLVSLKYIFNKELQKRAVIQDYGKHLVLLDSRTWLASLVALATIVILFIFQPILNWDAWMIASFGFTMLLFMAPKIDLDSSFAKVEITLLTFFVALFIVIGGVEESHFFEYLGGFIFPYAQGDLLLTTLVLMWSAAILSSLIDNIPFTVGMIPVILGLETHGINVTPLWWALAIGAGMGGNGTYLGSTANVYIVSLSERIAKEYNDPSLAITPGYWFKKGTPAMFLSLLVSSALIVFFFDFFSMPIH